MSQEYGDIIAGDTTYDVEELVQHFENDTLYDFLELDLKDMTEAQRMQFIDDFRDGAEIARDDLDELQEGLKDELKEVDEEIQSSKAARIQREIDDLKELEDMINCELAEAVEGCVTKANLLLRRTDEDVFINSGDIGQYETVYVNATGGDPGIFETVDSTAREDLDGDGMLTYRDEEIRLDNEALDRIDLGQSIFIGLEPEDIVQSVAKVSDGITRITITNSLTGETKFIDLEGLQDGVDVYFDFSNENTIPESQYKSWDTDFQKLAFFNDNMFSVYDNLHKDEVNKTSFIGNIDNIMDSIPEMVPQYAANGSSGVAGYVEEGIETLFGFLNESEGELNNADQCTGDFIRSISGLDQSLQEDIVTTLIMTLALKGGSTYWQAFFSGTAAGQFHNVLLADGNLSAIEQMVIMVSNLQIPGAGHYGSAGDFWGNIFYRNEPAGGDPYVEFLQDEWSDIDQLKEAFALYKETIAQISWASDDGSVDECLKDLETKQETQDSGYVEVVDEVVRDSIDDAIGDIDKTDGGTLQGIKDDEYLLEVTMALKALYQVALQSPEQAAASLLLYIDGLDDSHKNDVAAGVVYYLYKAGGAARKLLKTMCETVSGFKNSISATMGDFNAGARPERHDDAQDYLDKY